jgi:hypothetical protein
VPPPPAVQHAALVPRWTFCPFSLGASTAYACAVPQCEVPLTPAADGRVTLQPVALALDCLRDPLVVLPPDLAGGGLPPRVEVLIRYRLVDPSLPAPDQLLREAVLRLPVWTVAPTEALNTNPGFGSPAVEVDHGEPTRCDTSDLPHCTSAGTLAPGAPLAIQATVDPTTIQSYAVGDRTAAEAFTLFFFTTAGRFKDARGSVTANAPTTGTELRYEEITVTAPPITQALLWVVLLDLRGGQAVEGPFLVTLTAGP